MGGIPLRLCFLDAKTLGPDIDLAPLRCLGELRAYQTTAPGQITERLRDAEVAIVNKTVLTAEILDALPALRMVALCSTGVNVVDLDYCRARGIAVANVAGYSTVMVAQHTFAMLFYLMEGLGVYDRYVKSGGYAGSDIFTHFGPPIRELWGKRWGVIGLGAIGGAVARIAEAFGAKAWYFSASGKNRSRAYPRAGLEELLAGSDVVSIHTALTPATKGLIGKRELAFMKPSAYLLNLGRGGIVDEAALAAALDGGRLAGAGLDVLETEPVRADNPLLRVREPDRLLITPHIAWASVEARNRLAAEVAANIAAFQAGERRGRVD